jgi:hypothetical protein
MQQLGLYEGELRSQREELAVVGGEVADGGHQSIPPEDKRSTETEEVDE